MKKVLLLTFASLCLATITHAQIKKGSKLLGADASFSTTKREADNNNNEKSNYFSFSPSLGFATKDNTITGFRLSYGNSNYRRISIFTQPINRETNSYSAGVFKRKYKQLGSSVYLFGEAGADLHYSKVVDKNFNAISETNETNTGASLSLYPGFAYLSGRKLLIEAGLNRLLAISYSRNKYETKNTVNGVTTTNYTKSNTLNASTTLGANLGFSLGFRFLFAQ